MALRAHRSIIQALSACKLGLQEQLLLGSTSQLEFSPALQQEQCSCSSSSRLVSHYSASTSSVALPRRHVAARDEAVPDQILQELSSLESHLHRQSQRDGLKRLQFSTAVLPVRIPEHEVEPGLHTIDVYARPVEGRNACKWLRESSRTPARVQSLPGNRSLLLHMSKGQADRLVQLYGRTGCQARVVALRVLHPDNPEQVLAMIRAKPQMVHMTANKVVVENIDFLWCPRDRVVNVNVPVRLVNEEHAPGVKRGGWMHILRRTVPYQALGSSIPPFVEVDVRGLELDQAFTLGQLPVLPGTRIPTAPDWSAPVVRCTSSTGND